MLQHFYAVAYFVDPNMQSFYKRFVRDYMRYQDWIFCAGAQLLDAIRSESRSLNPSGNGEFYALHIRRQDIHVTEAKVEASETLQNLRFANKTPIIPPGSYVSPLSRRFLKFNSMLNRYT